MCPTLYGVSGILPAPLTSCASARSALPRRGTLAAAPAAAAPTVTPNWPKKSRRLTSGMCVLLLEGALKLATVSRVLSIKRARCQADPVVVDTSARASPRHLPRCDSLETQPPGDIIRDVLGALLRAPAQALAGLADAVRSRPGIFTVAAVG